MLTPERKSELCLTCGNCCKQMLVHFPAPRDFSRWGSVFRWMEARGVKRAPQYDTPYAFGGVIDMPCPHLQPDNRCGIYETRPTVCREFDGLRDWDGDCAWKGVEC